MKQAFISLMAVAVLGTVGCAQEQDRHPQPVSADNDRMDHNRMDNNQADNTGQNERDRSPEALTAGDQGGSERDRTITAQVRRDVVADGDIGTNAKNVKIITRDGVVTLRGPVSSAEERAALERYATRVAGVQSVDNQIEIAE